MERSIDPLENMKFFNKDELSLEYTQWGNGKKTLFVFHGFGRTYADFRCFTNGFEEKYTIVGVNIFFHGQSEIGNRNVDKNPLELIELKSFFEDFLASLHIQSFSLLGYSLGGRICLKLLEEFAERVDQTILLAPDGLIVNRWYALLSHNKLGRAVFRWLIRHNDGFYFILDKITQMGLISRRLKTFVLNEIRTTESQWKVYNVWSFLRKIEPDFRKLGQKLKVNNSELTIVIGKHDKIIPLGNTKKLKRVYPTTKVYVAESGHALISDSVKIELERNGLFNYK